MTDSKSSEFFSKDEISQRKKIIFDSMGKRTQKAILKKGYDNWDPFQEPKDPIEIRVDKTGNTVSSLVDKFFEAYPETRGNNAYKKVVEEMALGVVTEDDRVKASCIFSLWYRDMLKKAGISDGWL